MYISRYTRNLKIWSVVVRLLNPFFVDQFFLFLIQEKQIEQQENVKSHIYFDEKLNLIYKSKIIDRFLEKWNKKFYKKILKLNFWVKWIIIFWNTFSVKKKNSWRKIRDTWKKVWKIMEKNLFIRSRTIHLNNLIVCKRFIWKFIPSKIIHSDNSIVREKISQIIRSEDSLVCGSLRRFV